MGNKSKVDQSAQRHINDYERAKMLRVKENQQKLRELGVKNIAKSLTSLAETTKPKKRKEKPTSTNEKDENYIPGLDDDPEGDYQEEIDASVGAQKKPHRPKYIAPMSMNKFANPAKQRVMTHDVFKMSPFEGGFEQNSQLLEPNGTKRSRLYRCEKGHELQSQVGDLSAPKHNQSTTNLTMGELLNKKEVEKIKRVNNQNLANSNSTSTSISRRQTRASSLIDNDSDDWEDGLRCQDQDDIEKDGAEEDESEDDESEDSENMEFEVRENGMENFYSEVYAENEDDGLVHEDTIALPSTKKRGPTMMHGVHVRELNKLEVIICNKLGQPIGPSIKGKDTVGEFSRFLGTIARTYSYAPLNCISWHKVSHKERMWEYVLNKYIVPDVAKSWVLKSIGASWRVHKCRVKQKHYNGFKDNKTRWKNRPDFIPEDDFYELLRFWSRKEVKNRCSRARDARMSQKNMHTAGPKSFARIYEEMTNEDPNKEPPNLTQMFERTRKRTEGNVYVDSYDDTAKKIEQMKIFKPPEDESASVDPFLAVMSKEYDGRCRLYGRGVTNRLLKKVGCGGEASYEVPEVIMESLKSSLEEEKK